MAVDEALLFGIVELLKTAGDARSVAVLLTGEVEVVRERYDNWNGGLYYVSVELRVDYETYGRLDEPERKRIVDAVGGAAEPILACGDNDTFCGVSIRPAGKARDGWRDEIRAWLPQDGVNNQGRAHSANVAPREHDGLRFRSPAEERLYDALKRRAVTFAPLPVFIRGGPSFHRLEPDFLIIRDGVVFQVEIDGDTYHRESPVEAQDRTRPMEFEGVRVRRYRASDVETEEGAARVVDAILKWIEKEKSNRA